MVERLVCSLADYDSFWLSSVDCCGRMSIDPIVKFLAAQKMICFGVSFSAFKDYFQMGESTARLCLEKFTRGIVKCTADDTSDLNQNVVGDFDKTNVRDNIRKYAIVQKRWNELYSEENSLRLQDAVKKFVFKKHFGDDGTLDSLEMAEDYDPLIY